MKKKLEEYLAGTPLEFKHLLTWAFNLPEEYFTPDNGYECVLNVGRRGQFIEQVDIQDLDDLKGALLNAKHACQEHGGGHLTLQVVDNGWMGTYSKTVTIF